MKKETTSVLEQIQQKPMIKKLDISASKQLKGGAGIIVEDEIGG